MTTTTIDANQIGVRAAAGTGARFRVGADIDCSPVRALGVLIVDDDRDAGYRLWALLRWRPGIRVGLCRSAEAIRIARQERPAVCLASAALGLRRIHRLTQLPGGARVLVYTAERGADLEGAAVIAGADRALWRYDDPDRLVDAIRGAASRPRRRVALPPAVVHRLIDRLEDRDRAIAALLLMATPADQIAGTLGMSARSLRARRWAMVVALESAVALESVPGER